MKSKNFSFGFAENISKFIILKENIGKIRSFYKFYRINLNIQKVKLELKVTRAQKF